MGAIRSSDSSSPWADEPPAGWANSLGIPYLEIHDTLPSTNDHLRSLAASGVPLFSTVVARSQNEGRGREGKRWYSASDSGLWISVLLPTAVGRELEVGVLPLAVGIAAARAVESVAGVKVGLKWPNDLLLSGAKFAGILCEVASWAENADQGSGGSVNVGEDHATKASTRRVVVAGIGIDLRRPGGELPEEMGEGVSFLEEVTGTQVRESQLAATLLVELRRWTDPVPLQLEGDLRREWEARDALDGKAVRVLGVAERTGVARGVAAGGALLLEGAGGEIEELWAGTIRPLEAGRW